MIKGVNLGNWLVLEKWMSPYMFAGTTAEDEHDLCRQLPEKEKTLRYLMHRESYITRRDFAYIASRGIDSVRIPVPHFVFGDRPPYVGAIDYLDRAFEWAAEYGLSILIDLHTAPDSQNGFDNGGICGVCKWHLKEENITRVLDVLEGLAKRYGTHPALMGIELLNEPISKELWDVLQQMNRYPPSDPDYARGSTFVPSVVLRDFYRRGYERLRQHLAQEKAIVIHDGFRLEEWQDFMQEPEYQNVILDTHFYFMGAPSLRDQGIERYVDHVIHEFESKLAAMAPYFPLIVGEWCLSNQVARLGEMSASEKRLVYQMIGHAQLKAWQKGIGWYFWSYKLYSDMPGWDMGQCIEHDWFSF